MTDKWMTEPDKVRAFNELPPAEYMNVVSLTGKPVQQPDPEGLAASRIIAHLNERITSLEDHALRQAQALQDVVDDSAEYRPDLEALLEDGHRLLAVGGEA
ncbi:hypothetical protein [uncultured Endozoicomonas sp.]|uniref:hypothetical protein n=1 Tax=uncultured Endozoicomonas sp. TaxID=432652 RepID=UPI00261F8D89|nr:hypothetical protein [uncultured Endozoicomonas sp.]